MGVWYPDWILAPKIAGLGITLPQAGCFLAFWFVNVLVVWKGIDTIRVLLNVKDPLEPDEYIISVCIWDRELARLLTEKFEVLWAGAA